MKFMRKITLPTIRFVYLNEPDTEDRFWRAYNRIFSGLREEIIRKKKLQQEGGGELNMRRYAIYAYAPKDLEEREELVKTKIETLKEIAEKENMKVIKTMRDLEGDNGVFKELWGDIYEGSVTGILCEGIDDLVVDSSLESLLYKLIFDMGVEIRTPHALFRSDLPGKQCWAEVSQVGGMW